LIVNPDVGSMPAYHMAKRYNPKLKVIWAFHGLTPVPYVGGIRDRALMRIRKAAYIVSMKRADVIQVFSDYIKNEAAEWGVPASRIVVMPFGIDLKKMASGDGRGIREKYGAGGMYLLLYVGRLVGFKHVDELIRAVSLLDGPGLMVVGSGPELEKLRKLSRELRVEGRVWFAGRVPDEDLPGYYAACDVLATASRHEGFCVPVAEAMAAGKPAIVPDAAAMPETAGEAGRIYPSGDVKALAEAISSMTPDAAPYCGLAGKARAGALRYDLDGVIKAYVEFIRRQGEGHEG
jgi:glycosyltransferase involved in cell wall biosynthesis